MDKKKTAGHRFPVSKRRLIQLYAALLYNAHAKGFIKGEIYTGPLKNLCVPGLNCYSCPGAVGACPLGALQNALSASGTRAPWYVLGILLLQGLILGRTICGWLCPMGLIQELLHKIPFPKLKKSPVTRVLSKFKYVLLAVTVILIPLFFGFRDLPLPAFCKYICPAGTLEGAVGLLLHPNNAELTGLLGFLFANKLIILILLLIACVFVFRPFCRFLCPLGAIYGLFSRLSFLGVRVDASRCTDCGKCVLVCKADIRKVGDAECIHCGDCVSLCPEKAISWQAGSIHLAPNEVPQSDPVSRKKSRLRKSLLGIAGLLLLLGVLIFANVAGSPSPEGTEPPADEITVGFEVGQTCPDFTVPLYGENGGTFTLSDHIGKPVIINIWATWCNPCVKELPYFQALYDEYGDRFTLLALHANPVTEDVNAFILRSGLSLPFGQDPDGTVVTSLGGSTLLPQTVILDSTGRIVYNRAGSVTLDDLKEILEPLFQ